MIELPTSSIAIPLKEMNVKSEVKVVVPHSTKADFIESAYEIAEILQKICSKMNSYFGKKVRIKFSRYKLLLINFNSLKIEKRRSL